MHRNRTKYLLDQLEQVHAKVQEHDNIPLGMFGNFFANPKDEYKPKTPKPKLFIENTTQDEMTEISTCKTKITNILKELEAKQEEAFSEQKKITKRCYDMFSKYEGPEQSSDWMRSLWFGLHFNERDRWFNKHYKKDRDKSRQCIPMDWETKMRFGKPSTYAVTQDEQNALVKKQEEYKQKKEAWESYVDSKWDTAYDDAFGVKEFLTFIKDIPDRINLDLYSITAEDISKKWNDLYEETLYFKEKISMDHIRIDGWTMSLMSMKTWRTDSIVVTSFLEKFTELSEYVSYLYYLRISGWDVYDDVDTAGKNRKKYTWYNRRTKERIEMYTPPQKPKGKNR